MSTSYSDGDFTVASLAGPEIYSAPIAGVATEYLRTAPMMQEAASFVPLAIGSAHPEEPDTTKQVWWLAQETDRQSVGNGLVRWNRIWTKHPLPHTEYESMAYNFIGLYADPGAPLEQLGFATVNPTGRYRFSLSVPCRIVNEYYRIATPAVPASGVYAAASDVPIVPSQKYYWGTNPLATGLWTDYLTDLATHGVDSTPSKAAYLAMIAAGTWIVAQDSTLSRWLGSIYRRQVIYVQAR